MYCYSSSPSVKNSILWDNIPQQVYVLSGSPTLEYCDVQGGTGESWFGAGCIDSNPIFVKGAIHNYYVLVLIVGMVQSQITNSMHSLPEATVCRM